MAQQTINVGTADNAGDGDPLRTAGTKINANFDELYAAAFYFLGTYVSLAALQTAHASPPAGSYAHVDAGAATDIVQYIWDDTDSIYVAGGSGGAAAPQVTSQEKTDGTQIALRSFSPLDVAEMAGTHGGGSGGSGERLLHFAFAGNPATNAESNAIFAGAAIDLNENLSGSLNALVRTLPTSPYQLTLAKLYTGQSDVSLGTITIATDGSVSAVVTASSHDADAAYVLVGGANDATISDITIAIKATESPATPPGSGGDNAILDAAPNPVAAFGMKRLRTAYTGNLITVRRASDNVELAIGQAADGSLDEAALIAHCTGTDGFVSQAFDQGTNGNDFAPSSSVNQPKIYDSVTGIIRNSGGNPAMDFQGPDDDLRITGYDPTATTAFSLVFEKDTTDDAGILFVNGSLTSAGNYSFAYSNAQGTDGTLGAEIGIVDGVNIEGTNSSRSGLYNLIHSDPASVHVCGVKAVPSSGWASMQFMGYSSADNAFLAKGKVSEGVVWLDADITEGEMIIAQSASLAAWQ